MPVENGEDKYGSYFRWGRGKKYYYIVGNKRSRDYAKLKAQRQGRVVWYRIKSD